MTSPNNRYEIIGTIGTGATSRVDIARDSVIGRTVALKTFLRSFSSEDIQKQFLREAQIIGRLAHPFIVGLFDVGSNQDGVPYLVMEYVEGKTLESALNGGPLPLERAVVWAADLASALARAHQCKIIHGDVKPANVLITGEGQVKLGDFGIARFATQLSGSGALLGTPAYLSPEQILGHKQDTRSDLFSLGIILYQMTTGVRPFDGTSVSAVCAQIISAEPPPPSHHNPELPPEFDHLVMRCLAKNPANRYATAEALGASLYPFGHSNPVSLASPVPSWWKRPIRSSDLRIAAGVLGLAFIGGGAHAIWPHGASNSDRNVARLLAPRGTATGFGPAQMSPSPNAEPFIINTSAADVAPPDQQFASLHGTESLELQGDTAMTGGSTKLTRASENSSSPPMAIHAVARRPAPSPKGKPLQIAGKPDASDTSSPGGPHSAPRSASSVVSGAAVSAAGKAVLHVDVLSTVTDETLSVFSGDELLLATPLQGAHLGDTLRFDCPVLPGEHLFRVVLTRPDDSVVLEKDNTSAVRAEAANSLGVHVLRRTKLLLKHETSLEVVWPSTPAPVVAGSASPVVGALAMR